MPYSSNKDLNPKTKKAFKSSTERDAFRKAFNSVAKKDGDESKSFAVASSAAKKAGKKKNTILGLSASILRLRSSMENMKKKMKKEAKPMMDEMDEKFKHKKEKNHVGMEKHDDCINDSLTVLSSITLENGSEKIQLSFRATDVKLAANKDELTISGTALTEGAFQGKGMTAPVSFDASFLEKVAPKFVGMPLMYAHSDKPSDIVGKVVSSVYNASKKIIEFVAKIKDPNAIWKVKDGLLGAVSVGMNLTSAVINKGVKQALDADAIELSLVRQPACPGCLINKLEE